MVAAMMSYRYLVEMRSAALRKMAARSAKESASHAGLAASAASMAFLTSSPLALEYVATTSEWFDGLYCVPMFDVLIYCSLR
jgi:hypothetical protein